MWEKAGLEEEPESLETRGKVKDGSICHMRACGGSSVMKFAQKIREENDQLEVGVGEYRKAEKEEKMEDSHPEAMDND